MNRLLIVDDEPDVVEGLYRLFRSREELELDIYRACSGAEALQVMRRERIDVMLSDIRMPGMTGLELFDQVRGQWPRCRVVFLTGHTDFESIYRASRDGAASYLLKTEDHASIVEAVCRALDELKNVTRVEELTSRVNQYAASVRAYRSREILCAWVAGELAQGWRQAMQALGGFDAEAPVLMLAMMLNGAPPGEFPERTRVFLAMEELMGAYLGGGVSRAMAEVERGLGLGLFQGGALSVAQLKGAAEAMQSALTADWSIDVSVALYGEPVTAQRVPHCYESLAKLLRRELSFGAGILVAQQDQAVRAVGSEARAITLVKDYIAAHLDQELSLTLLAAQVFLNPSYLSRLFRRDTGMTLMGYINSARIEKARELLVSTNMRIAGIAAQVGLESPSYFNQVFRRHCGVSPQEYRMNKVK